MLTAFHRERIFYFPGRKKYQKTRAGFIIVFSELFFLFASNM